MKIEDVGKQQPPQPRIRQVPAVTRAVAILRLLGESTSPLGVTAIAESLSLVPSTCLHILRALVAEGLVRMDAESKRYELGNGMLSLARSVIERSSFAGLVQPVLDRLAREHDVTAIGVAIEDRAYMMVLAISRSRIRYTLHVEVGRRFPSLISATGRLYAAHGGLDPLEIEEAFANLRWDRPIKFKDWKGEVEQARKKGFALDRDQYINGITVVAVPLLNRRGMLTHTVVCAGLSEQLDNARLHALTRDLGQEAKQLSSMIMPLG